MKPVEDADDAADQGRDAAVRCGRSLPADPYAAVPSAEAAALLVPRLLVARLRVAPAADTPGCGYPGCGSRLRIPGCEDPGGCWYCGGGGRAAVAESARRKRVALWFGIGRRTGLLGHGSSASESGQREQARWLAELGVSPRG